MAKVTSKRIPEVRPVEPRVASFDAATRRQQARQQGRAEPETPETNRGWKRHELYRRDHEE
jgi:hypothetical protein